MEFCNEELITDHNRDCIFRQCKKFGTINYQELIRRHNPEINWDQEVTRHQWQNVIVGENNANEGAQKSPNKECVDRVVNHGVIKKEHSKNNTGSMPNKKQDKKRKILDKVRYRGTLAQLLTLFITSLSQISIHLFHFRWQAFQSMSAKSN